MRFSGMDLFFLIFCPSLVLAARGSANRRPPQLQTTSAAPGDTATSSACCWLLNEQTKKYQFYPKPARQQCQTPYTLAQCPAPKPVAAAAGLAVVAPLNASNQSLQQGLLMPGSQATTSAEPAAAIAAVVAAVATPQNASNQSAPQRLLLSASQATSAEPAVAAVAVVAAAAAATVPPSALLPPPPPPPPAASKPTRQRRFSYYVSGELLPSRRAVGKPNQTKLSVHSRVARQLTGASTTPPAEPPLANTAAAPLNASTAAQEQHASTAAQYSESALHGLISKLRTGVSRGERAATHAHPGRGKEQQPLGQGKRTHEEKQEAASAELMARTEVEAAARRAKQWADEPVKRVATKKAPEQTPPRASPKTTTRAPHEGAPKHAPRAATCEAWCNADPHPWAKKCEWERGSGHCSKCVQCEAFARCKPWCESDASGWQAKCKWSDCSSCTSCPRKEPAAASRPWRAPVESGESERERSRPRDAKDAELAALKEQLANVRARLEAKQQPEQHTTRNGHGGSPCKTWCAADAHPWAKKCEWGSGHCSKCGQCEGVNGSCKPWCKTHATDWESKCSWGSGECGSCSSCPPKGRKMSQHSEVKSSRSAGRELARWEAQEHTTELDRVALEEQLARLQRETQRG